MSDHRHVVLLEQRAAQMTPLSLVTHAAGRPPPRVTGKAGEVEAFFGTGSGFHSDLTPQLKACFSKLDFISFLSSGAGVASSFVIKTKISNSEFQPFSHAHTLTAKILHTPKRIFIADEVGSRAGPQR